MFGKHTTKGRASRLTALALVGSLAVGLGSHPISTKGSLMSMAKLRSPLVAN